ncbi:SIMPL domain-containing protein [Patescibacteria group bacterium]|nr:SIMPL domain-containing protein [Patescibacteria group bacterium]
MDNKSFWPKWPGQKMFYVLMGIVLVYAIVYLAVIIQNNLKEFEYIGLADRERDTISIEGEGKAIGTPDIATVNAGMVTEAKTVLEAQDANTEKMNSLIAEFKKMGLDSGDIQTVDYSIWPKYEYKEGASNIVGYTVSQSVQIKIRDTAKISLVLAAAGQAGANQVSGVQFGIDDPDGLKEEARLEALVDAKQKAQDLAQALGVSLGKVVGFSEYTYSPTTKGYLEYDGLGGAGEAPQVETGSLEIDSNVTVIYEIY